MFSKIKEIKTDYDIIIIGAGPGGYTAAIRASQLGKKVCIVEKTEVGGVCTNWGCIPTKTLVSSVEVLDKIKKAKRFGIVVDSFKPDFSKLMHRKNTVVKATVLGIKNLLDSNGIKLIYGEAKIINENNIHVNEKDLTCDNIIIATGSAPITLGVDIDGINTLTSREILDLESMPESLTIIGGGIIGIEFANIFASLGCKVTIIEMLPKILSILDEDIIEGSTKLIKKAGVKLLTNHKFMKVEGSTVTATNLDNDDEVVIEAEKVLFAIGRGAAPNKEECDKLGIKYERGIIVNAQMQTSVPNIYAIGDVTGKMILAHVASAQGRVAAEHIAGKEVAMDYDAIPSCVYIVPEIGQVGKKENEVKNAIIGKFPFIANGKARGAGETTGFIKVIFENEVLVGCHILGSHASDIIQEAAIAIKNKLTFKQIIDTVHSHPGLSEVFKGACEDAYKEAIDLPKR